MDEPSRSERDEERFRRLLDTLADGVLVLDARGVVLWANPAAVTLTGRTVGQLLGLPFGLPLVRVESAELDVRSADGRSRPVELRVVASTWSGHEAMFASLRDVSDRRRTEADLARRHKLLLALHELGAIEPTGGGDAGIIGAVTRVLRDVTGADAVGLFEFDSRARPRPAGVDGPLPVDPSTLDALLGPGGPGGLAATGATAVWPPPELPAALGEAGLHHVLALPVRLAADRTGVLVFAGNAPLVGDEQDLAWFEALAAGVAAQVERLRMAAALADSERRFRLLAENAADVLFRYRVGPDAGFEYVSPSVERLTGYPPAAFYEEGFARRLVHPSDHPALDRPVEALGSGDPVLRLVRRDGLVVWVEIHATSALGDNGTVSAVEGIAHDVTDRRRFEAELTYEATHDALTGLPNRALFLDRLVQALARLERRHSGVAVLFVDLDDFKEVNDTYGHEAGDRVLGAVAHRIPHAVRPGDTVARFGGDEFAVLCEDLSDLGDAEAVGHRIVDLLEETVVVGGQKVRIGGSVGIYLASEPGESVENVLRNADLAMYRAKAAGRGRVALFDPSMAAEAVARLEHEQALQHLLVSGDGDDLGGLELHLQPVVDLTDGSVVGFECFLRWSRDGAPVPPEALLQAAERAGLAAALHTWVLRSAARAGAALRLPERAGARRLWVATNISTRALLHPGVEPAMLQAATALWAAGCQLCVELSERVLATSAAVELLGRLRRRRALVAIDDFATGHTSLTTLHTLPVDLLKLDRSFMTGLDHLGPGSEIVATVVELGRRLSLGVVAEGVETPAEYGELLRLGCPYGQGFLFCPPLPVADLVGLLDQPLGPAIPRGV